MKPLVLALLLPVQALAEDADAWLDNLAVLQIAPDELDRRGITVTRLGDIQLPTGRIIAVDPYTVWGLTPFDRRVTPGRYPVYLWFDATEPTRPALAELRLRACTPIYWQNAAPEGESLFGVPAGEAYGYGVDAGTGSFAAPEFFETFGMIDDGHLEGDAYYAFAQGPLFQLAFPDETGIPQDFIVQNDGQDMAVFSSGWGDGFYASYWGFDPQGCPCTLVTDFGVLDRGYPYDTLAARVPGPKALKAPRFAMWGRDTACGES